jgi:hypothetical protein
MSGHSVNQTLNKVIAERRKKRKQKAEAKRVERREKLIKEQENLLSIKESAFSNLRFIEEEKQR